MNSGKRSRRECLVVGKRTAGLTSGPNNLQDLGRLN